MLAPMAGITDWPFRLLCKRNGADVLVSEMISAMGLLQSPKGNLAYQQLLASHPEETGLIAQVFGKEPAMMGEAAGILDALPQYFGIDINFGCPAPKVTGSGGGSALMKDLPLSRKIIASVRRSVKKTLSAKMRLGWGPDSINVLDFAKMCRDEGVDTITVHGRTRQQQYAGKADWDMIAKVKQALDIPVFANGDVFTAQDAKDILDVTGADGIAVGRGALGNPWLFNSIKHAFSGEAQQPPSQEDILQAALSHLEDMVAFKGEKRALIEMRKHFAWYLKGSPGAAKTRALINQTEDLDTLKAIVNAHFTAPTD